MEWATDHVHLRWATEQHGAEGDVQVKHSRTVSLSHQECHLHPQRSQQQQIPMVAFQAELRQAFWGETPREKFTIIYAPCIIFLLTARIQTSMEDFIVPFSWFVLVTQKALAS
ncbi:SNRPN upstream reading frame protein-like [Ursus americanus]|uniref:SNRPN upstream reading frame protein-like n=1 Tax=Ursus americanus TaxID=9643 RepID=UPI001E67B1CE|nr:SNRPN upstream reading frame protein-like [Ursus americanus]